MNRGSTQIGRGKREVSHPFESLQICGRRDLQMNFYALPSAFRTLSGVSGGAIHLADGIGHGTNNQLHGRHGVADA